MKTNAVLHRCTCPKNSFDPPRRFSAAVSHGGRAGTTRFLRCPGSRHLAMAPSLWTWQPPDEFDEKHALLLPTCFLVGSSPLVREALLCPATLDMSDAAC